MSRLMYGTYRKPAHMIKPGDRVNFTPDDGLDWFRECTGIQKRWETDYHQSTCAWLLDKTQDCRCPQIQYLTIGLASDGLLKPWNVPAGHQLLVKKQFLVGAVHAHQLEAGTRIIRKTGTVVSIQYAYAHMGAIYLGLPGEELAWRFHPNAQFSRILGS